MTHNEADKFIQEQGMSLWNSWTVEYGMNLFPLSGLHFFHSTNRIIKYQNWYGQSILIPQLCSTACLLLKDANLTASQREGCIRIPKRAYDLRDGIYGTGGRMTGANVRSRICPGLLLKRYKLTFFRLFLSCKIQSVWDSLWKMPQSSKIL